MTNKKETVLEMVKRIYKDIDSKQTKNYGTNFIADLVIARPEINKQCSLLNVAKVAYSDEVMYKILENVGLKKYF